MAAGFLWLKLSIMMGLASCAICACAGANVTRLPDGGFIRDWHEVRAGVQGRGEGAGAQGRAGSRGGGEVGQGPCCRQGRATRATNGPGQKRMLDVECIGLYLVK